MKEPAPCKLNALMNHFYRAFRKVNLLIAGVRLHTITVTTIFTVLTTLVNPMAKGSAIEIGQGASNIGSWGPSHAAYGQSFVSPVGVAELVSYDFSLLSLNAQFPFISQVYRWNPAGFIEGNALFTSAVRQSPAPTNQYTRYTFEAGLAVDENTSYIAIITNYQNGQSLGGPLDGTVGGQIEGNPNDPYPYGGFWFASGSQIFGNVWYNTLFQTDAVFSARFSSISVNTSINSWMLVGLMASVWLLRIRSFRKGTQFTAT